MDAPLKHRLQEDMKLALRERDKPRLGVIRMMLAAIQQMEIDKRVALDDAEIYQILGGMVKQSREARAQYDQAGRKDLAERASFEETTIQSYLPTPLTPAETDDLITQVIQETDAASIKDMGRVMAVLKPRCQGRADIGLLSAQVKRRLSASLPKE